MGRILYIGLILLLSASFQRDWIILGAFKLNQEYLAKEQCVQKEVEGNCCQASCVLRKNLEEADKAPEAEQSEHELLILYPVVDKPTITGVHLTPPDYFRSEVTYYENYSQKHLSKVFHPPRLCS